MGHRRIEHGSEAAAVRRSCALPLVWGKLSDATLRSLLQTVSTLTDGRRRPRARDDANLRAVGRILLSLQTGRAGRDLTSLSVRRVKRLTAETCHRGAVLTGDGGYLIIPPHGSVEGDQQQETPYLPVSRDIVLPLSAPLKRVINRLVPSEASEFTCELGGDDKAVRRLLRGEGDWRARTTKAERSLRSAEAWFRHRTRVIEGGDPALSAILDPNLRGAENTLSHYATIASDKFWKLYRAAIAPLDGTVPARPPEVVRHKFYGNPRCPDAETLRPEIASLLVRAERPAPALRRVVCSDQNPISRRDHHVAMMMRCFVAVTFGTGQRGVGQLVNFDQVDPDTGFAWVVEKSNPMKGYSGSRGVFHPLTVRRHLAAYEDYLDALAKTFECSAPGAAIELAALRACPGLTFFDSGKDGQLVRLTQNDLCQAAQAMGWVYSPNAGRRWLRSILIGRVPSDALAAQFGHHLDGFDVWGKHSGLAPQKVAAVLESAIQQALSAIGLDEVPESARAHSPGFDDPVSVPPQPNMRFRAGQILASAIWNGAMLDQEHEGSLLDRLDAILECTHLPGWIEFELRERFNQQRWRLDEKTRALLLTFPGHRFPAKAGGDRLLAEFLGSNAAVGRFRDAALTRWRFRLPPILFAKSIGALSNHSLRDERFEPGRRKSLATYGQERSREPRHTCNALVQCFKGYWRDEGHWDGKIFRRDKVPTWLKKKRVHAALSASLHTKWFFKDMTRLEQSLAQGLIDGFVVDRGYNNVRGYSSLTQSERARRLWKHFVPSVPVEWQATSIVQLPRKIVLDAVNKGAWSSQIASDLITIFTTMASCTETTNLIDSLSDHAENYSVNIIHPNEYQILINKTTTDERRDWVVPALTLCYRTGLRFTELRAIVKARILNDRAGPALMTLDHHPEQRLKTFHSRRSIPLDVMLNEEELEALRTLIGKGQSTIFREHVSTLDQKIIDRLDAATGTFTSVFPLRHSFATNALAALLWPDDEDDGLAYYIDPLLIQRKQMLRDRLCGAHSLGAIAPHALAVVMGHTSPQRTLFSYAHHLEVMVAAHVQAVANAIRPPASTSRLKRRRRVRAHEHQIWFGDPITPQCAA